MLASHKKTMTLVVCSVSMFLSSLAYAITHTYDSLNRLTNVRYENGQVIEYKYDSGGNISTIRSMLPTNSAIPSPTSLKAELNADNTILLSWGFGQYCKFIHGFREQAAMFMTNLPLYQEIHIRL